MDGNFSAGETYVVFGSAGGFGENIETSDLNGLNGFVVQGTGGRDYSGSTLSGLGDINGDGIDDFAIGAANANSSGKNSVGEVYIIFGDDNIKPAAMNVSSLNGSNGFTIEGIDAGDRLAASGNIGDVNGDGINDIFLGAPGGDANAYDSGEAYVIYGRNDFTQDRLELSDFDNSQGFAINGVGERERTTAIGSAGDFNGDGVGDFILSTDSEVTSRNGNFISFGKTYIVFGRDGGFTDTVELSELDGSNGFAVSNGTQASSAGDINGDGFDDVAIGLPGGPSNESSVSGQTYIIFGFSTGLNGTDDEDVLNGSFLGDEIFGFAGDDELLGGRGNDLLIGGSGADILDGGEDIDVASYHSSSAGISIDLSTGVSFGGDAEGDTIQNIEGITGSDFNDTLIGDIADNRLQGLAGNDIIDGMAGQDYIEAGSGRDTVFGGDGSDTIFGGSGADSLFGGTQDDKIEGNGGKDKLFGNEGNDTLSAGGGRDQLDGGIGNDILIGGDSGDFIQGGDGNDQIEGRRGSDTIFGGAGNDLIIGNGLTDIISGDSGNDIIRGGGGSDILNGNSGNDQIFGGSGNDEVSGGLGDDTLSGGGGDDILSGGGGIDILSGNGGSDTFVFNVGDEEVSIIDFRNGTDKIDLTDFDFIDANDAIAAMVEENGDVFLLIGNDTLTINNTSLIDILDDIIV